jgi:hypothetical protein
MPWLEAHETVLGEARSWSGLFDDTAARSESGLLADVAWTALGAGVAGVLVVASQWLGEKLQQVDKDSTSSSKASLSETSPLFAKDDLDKSRSSADPGKSSISDQETTFAAGSSGGLIAPILLVNIPIVLGS